jgi:hypothetical protein
VVRIHRVGFIFKETKMDIIDVLIGQYESEMNEHFFNIDSILRFPHKENALAELNTAVQSYALLKDQAEMLKDIKGQITAMRNQQEQEERYEN